MPTYEGAWARSQRPLDWTHAPHRSQCAGERVRSMKSQGSLQWSRPLVGESSTVAWDGLRPGIGLVPTWSGAESALRRACQEKLQHPPGTVFRYSDINYIVLGELVRRVERDLLAEEDAEAGRTAAQVDDAGRNSGRLGSHRHDHRPPRSLALRLARRKQRQLPLLVVIWAPACAPRCCQPARFPPGSRHFGLGSKPVVY